MTKGKQDFSQWTEMHDNSWKDKVPRLCVSHHFSVLFKRKMQS